MDICKCIIDHFGVHPKLTHCKPTILQVKKKKKGNVKTALKVETSEYAIVPSRISTLQTLLCVGPTRTMMVTTYSSHST